MSHQELSILVDESAVLAIETHAKHAWPHETGGLLLGNYPPERVHVTHAVEVPDPRATRIRYRRDPQAATQALDEHRAAISDASIGYVGEWHSHPLPSRPSAMDRLALRQLMQGATNPLVMLVAARTSRGFTLHTVVGMAANDPDNPVHIHSDVSTRVTPTTTGDTE